MTDNNSFIEINGCHLEGGGQILRTAISLSAITKKPCRIFNIRKGRKKPGLMTQHLLGIQNAAKLCQAWLQGDKLGSEEIKFYPSEIKALDIYVKIETAASITLLLQSLLPIAIFAQSPIKILLQGGGTDVPFSPTFDYFQYVFLKFLEKMNGKINIRIIKKGFYPEGGAEIEAKIFPSKIKSLHLTKKGSIKKIIILSSASESLKNKKVAERQIAGAKEILGKLGLPLEEKISYYKTQCPGTQICLLSDFENTIIGVDSLGKLGKRAEDVGRETAFALLKEEKSNTCLDKYLTDQILPYLALARAKSKIRISEITNHCKTNMWLIEKFIPGKFEIKDHFIFWKPRLD